MWPSLSLDNLVNYLLASMYYNELRIAFNSCHVFERMQVTNELKLGEHNKEKTFTQMSLLFNKRDFTSFGEH
jgi:hypothetical protein